MTEILSYTVTYLESDKPTEGPGPRPPQGPRTGALALLRAEKPSAEYFLYLYRAVGARWQWSDWLRRPRAAAQAFVQDPLVETFVLHLDGAPAGFFMLDFRPQAEGGSTTTAAAQERPESCDDPSQDLDRNRAGAKAESCELAYFGLTEAASGLGLGRWLLRTALARAWERPGMRKISVETCTLDHPAALALYQQAGFVPIGRAEKTRLFQDPEIFGF